MLTPPLDRSGVDFPPDTVWRHIKPPPICGLPEIHAYMDIEEKDEDEDKEPTDVASLRCRLPARGASPRPASLKEAGRPHPEAGHLPVR